LPNVAHAKTERLINLTMALMATSRFLTVLELGRLVDGYDPDDSATGGEAFRRMFERDKEELRELGIPLHPGPVDPLYGDEIGYRIHRSDYALPEISLDPDEAAALGLAARLWSSAHLSGTASSAIRKLAAAGAEPLAPPAGLEARVGTNEPAFEPLLDAVIARQEVTFDYQAPGSGTARRTLQPWGLVSWRGRWYVGGHDLDRDAPRVFRLSRMTGPVAPRSGAGSYTVPPGVDVRAMVTSTDRDDPRERRLARIRVRPGTAHRLRLQGQADESDPDLLDVPFYAHEGFADMLAGYGPDVLVLEPTALRQAVVDRLRAVGAGR